MPELSKNKIKVVIILIIYLYPVIPVPLQIRISFKTCTSLSLKITVGFHIDVPLSPMPFVNPSFNLIISLTVYPLLSFTSQYYLCLLSCTFKVTSLNITCVFPSNFLVTFSLQPRNYFENLSWLIGLFYPIYFYRTMFC